VTRLIDIDAASYVPHALHASARNWPETNCYSDLWIELIASLGLPPEAMFGFTVTQDFEGDQFTFFKPPLEDLESLYGLLVTELAIFDSVEAHAAVQLSRGRLVLVEVDGYYLPDTSGLSYRQHHTKTTIGINELNSDARRLGYFHNAGYFALDGEDFDGVFGRLPAQSERADALFPYVEFVKGIGRVRPGTDLRPQAEQLLSRHLARRPEGNPLRRYAAVSGAHIEDLLRRGAAFFDPYAFNTVRQLGANFDLLGSHLAWLGEGRRFDNAIACCGRISDGAKAILFQLARSAARRRPVDLTASLDEMADAYEGVMAGIAAGLG
jgi:hypothetical protein